jgi:uncharacterized RmlC-like cupin family protein
MACEDPAMSKTQDQSGTCRVIRGEGSKPGRQGLDVFAGVSAETAGSTGICLHLVVIPPGGRAKAHLHRAHETAIYILEGHAEMSYGDGLGERLAAGPGDFVYIPANTPHLPWNPSETEPCIGVVARTDPNEQESIELLPWLE